MKPTGFYKISQEYIELISNLGGAYRDNKERPIYCCLQDKDNPEIYWAIPTSDISHRNEKQMNRINYYCNLSQRDIRSCYYHIGHTNRPAIFKISNVLPLSEKYIENEYTSQGSHLILKDVALINTLSKKLSRILFDEKLHPNKYEQHITDIYTHINAEIIKLDKVQDSSMINDKTQNSTISDVVSVCKKKD